MVRFAPKVKVNQLIFVDIATEYTIFKIKLFEEGENFKFIPEETLPIKAFNSNKETVSVDDDGVAKTLHLPCNRFTQL